MKFLFLLGIIGGVFADSKPPIDHFSDEYIEYLNSKNLTWKAGRNFPKDIPISYFDNLMGALPESEEHYLPKKTMEGLNMINIPEQFDARTHWPNCPTIGEIRNQGLCGSCWAFGAVEAMSDRECIHSKGKVIFRFSAEDLLSCCNECGSCKGGISPLAWKYWISNGIVSGGPFGSKQGCRPYTIGNSEESMNGTRPQLGEKIQPTPKCFKSCESSYGKSYEDDLKYGLTAYMFINEEENVMLEIMTNGPVEGSFDVYSDFFHYKSGVYHHDSYSTKVGRHAIRILGWGKERDAPYWLVANSWGTTWGDNGFFKILRGKNECEIESYMIGGIPK